MRQVRTLLQAGVLARRELVRGLRVDRAARAGFEHGDERIIADKSKIRLMVYELNGPEM